uniref:SJCHGC02681 protein n=1 Tax=Schistosoma japonicum TaxID=6182 RepID=Q5BT60_SCHJA|nr:SJCHGC02681 protein [Schistosoma japonicum]
MLFMKGMNIMLVGSVDEVAISETPYLEDSKVVSPTEDTVKLPPGLVNLGNTCYIKRRCAVALLYSGTSFGFTNMPFPGDFFGFPQS